MLARVLPQIRRLAASGAHAIRGWLVRLENAISGLRREALDPSDRNVLLGILDEETDRLNRLVGDLLSYAKPSTPDRKTLQLADIIARAMDLARRGHPKSDDVQLDVQLDGGPLDVIADPDMLRQAFANVLENALQAMPTGGTITVRSGHASLEDQSAVAISFVDTGEGMDTLVRAKARDPFFTTRPSGTGLGLAIVDRLVRAHGGTMDIESRAGIGTTITLVIPEPIDRAAATRAAS